MSQTADSQSSDPTGSWQHNRDQLFEMIMHGRSFSGRERNCCFLNTDGKWFATASSLSGFDFPDDGRCIATTDWDRDGDVDVWTSNRSAPRIRFLRNNAHRQNAFLQFKLIGDGITTNRDAVGARLEVSLHNGRRILKTLRAGEGFLSQSSKSIHVGLGTDSQVDQVRIVWPNSQHSEQVFSNVTLNQRYVVTQGNANLSIESAVLPAQLDSFAATPLPALAATDVARVPMLTQLPMPQLDYLSLQTAPQTISFRTQEPTLVVLWATWCQPCLAELTALANQETQLAAKRIRIIALCVDEATENGLPDMQPIRSAIAKLDLPQRWSFGWLAKNQIEIVQQVHDHYFFLKKPLPLPSSFLVSASGSLVAIYRGPADGDQVLQDIQLDSTDALVRAQNAGCFAGTVLSHPELQAIAKQGDKQLAYRLATWLESQQRTDDAISHFQALISQNPDWSIPYRHLAKLYLGQNRLGEANSAVQQAIKLDDQDAAAFNTLALVFSQQGNHQAAITALRRAIELNQNFAEAYNNLGASLAATGQINAASDAFQSAVTADPLFWEAKVNLGRALAMQGKREPAIRMLRDVIANDPNNADAFVNLGTIHAQQGNLRDAILQFESALSINPQHAEALRNLKTAKQLLRN